jgi:hypothetical protein
MVVCKQWYVRILPPERHRGQNETWPTDEFKTRASGHIAVEGSVKRCMSVRAAEPCDDAPALLFRA